MKGKIAQRKFYDKVPAAVKDAMREYQMLTGRKYDTVLPYRLEDAEYAIVGSGCMIETGGRCGLSYLAADRMKRNKPHVVTLMIGTNDVKAKHELATAPARLAKILDTLCAADPNVLVMVAQIVPTKDDAQNELVKAFNAAIPALVQARAAAGKHVALVDMYGAFTMNPKWKGDYLADTLHPNPRGYDRMGDAWYDALLPFLR